MERKGMSVKLIQAGDFVTREFPIAVDDFTIGREYTCDLRLDHGRISRNHCRILKRGNRVLVEALYSTAGTAINQKILDPPPPPPPGPPHDPPLGGPAQPPAPITPPP